MIWALHGFLGRPFDWDFLSSDKQSVDLYKEQADFQTWARVFNKKVVQAEHQTNYLVGYSLGGRLALHVFAENPELYDGVLLFSAHPGMPGGDKGYEARKKRVAADNQWALRFESEDWSKLMADWNQQSVFSSLSSSHDSIHKESGLPERDEKHYDRQALAYCLREWSLGLQKNFVPLLKEHSNRFVFVQGQFDKKFSEIYTALKKEIPDLMFIEVEGSGHRILHDQPATVASIVRDLCR